MTDKDILLSDLNDISEILNNNGYGGWCVAIRKAVSLLKEQDTMLVEYSVFDGVKYGGCPRCNARIDNLVNPKACGYCRQAVKWE